MIMLTKDELLVPLAKLRKEEIVVTTMAAVRPWGRLSKHQLDFASADSAMGHAADLALGLAMAQPRRKVICLNGDGSMLMSLGTLATIVESGVSNLILFVLVNGAYEITGNQKIPARGSVDWSGLAHSAGFNRVYRFDESKDYKQALPGILHSKGPAFVEVEVEPGDEGPISRSGKEEAEYLKVSLAESARRLRKALNPSSVAWPPSGP